MLQIALIDFWSDRCSDVDGNLVSMSTKFLGLPTSISKDSVNRDKLYVIMYEPGISDKLVELNQMTMQHTEAQIRVHSKLTAPIHII